MVSLCLCSKGKIGENTAIMSFELWILSRYVVINDVNVTGESYVSVDANCCTKKTKTFCPKGIEVMYEVTGTQETISSKTILPDDST